MSFSIQAPTNVLELLERLHKQSLDQENLIKDANGKYIVSREMAEEKDENEKNSIRDKAMKDKFIALDSDKATFMYNLVRAIGALNVVEAGTSFGVSTMYLALAVAQNAEAAGKKPGEANVIGTEHWHEKAEVARQYWKEAGDAIEPWIQLREGDLRETLSEDLPTIDFVLFDIWTPMVVPTLKVIESKLKPGAVFLADNVGSPTTGYAEGYKDFFSIIKAPGSKYKTVTLPFSGGFEMVTYWP